MKHIILILLAAVTLFAAAQDVPHATLGTVTVNGHRPLKEIGVKSTRIDSAAIKENIAQSMADILAFNTPLYVKSYGRATMSTVSFRGTSPSHTAVTWNGLQVNSPMLGMTDFSTIPSFFVDNVTLLHGASGVNASPGALGGVIQLNTSTAINDGLDLTYTQGVGSYTTLDEFLKVSYGNGKWSATTRMALSTSTNDYHYTNRDKMLNIYDGDMNITGRYHPRECNRNGAWRDFNVLQEFGARLSRHDRLDIGAWWFDSNRELPLLTTDYGDARELQNRQREHTLRSHATWRHTAGPVTTVATTGYTHTSMAYDYSRETAPGVWSVLTRSRSRVNSFDIKGYCDWMPSQRWLLNLTLQFNQDIVDSSDRNVVSQQGTTSRVGYNHGRTRYTSVASGRWQATDRAGIALTLRQEIAGGQWTPLVPAIFADWLALPAGNVTIKASATRNHRLPTLNDLYFMPGGNPRLRSEKGWSYDVGASFDTPLATPFTASVNGSAGWFDSVIDDWIIWLPTTKGFFSPLNVKRVHAYGIESRLGLNASPATAWEINATASYSWTPSVNRGTPVSPDDASVGKQLPYVPRHSATATVHLKWRCWGVLYKWNYYSRRHTMSSNDVSITGNLPAYYMNNITLEHSMPLKCADLQFKLAVNNLFNEKYLSVLSRPMPGINFEFFVSVTPHTLLRHNK